MNTSESVIPSLGSPNIPSIPAPSSAEIVEKAKRAGSSFFSSVWFKAIIVIIVLAMLGLNVFSNLGDLTDKIQKFFSPYVKPIASLVADTVGDTARQTISVSAKGASSAINKTADVATSGIKQVQTALDSNIKSNDIPAVSQPTQNMPQQMPQTERQTTNDQVNRPSRSRPTVAPDSSSSTTQGRSGYCYVGMYGGVRSCAEVDSATECMSGDIFPTLDVCINPNLRA